MIVVAAPPDMLEIDRPERIPTDDPDAYDTALECLRRGIEAARPETLVRRRVSVSTGTLSVTDVEGRCTEYDLETYDDVVLVGAGNAAGHFAAALEGAFGDRLTGGAVVTDDPVETSVVDVLEGDHPVPSPRGVESTRTVLERARSAGANDLVVAAITGGGSALFAAPAEPLSIDDLRVVTEELLACGASIDEINAVRKHCSAIKGGRLARVAAPATVLTLPISDVVGDDPSVIASGPTVPDPSTYADALAVLDRYDLEVPDSVRKYLRGGADGDHPETPTADDPAFDRTDVRVIGNGRTALEAAADVAAERGYEPLVLASGVRGEAREAALTHVAIGEECREHGSPVEPPAVLLSGGETTVTLADDHGRGGPNQEFVLAGALALDRDDGGVVVSAVDTDGIDGATDVAGAIADATTVPERAGRSALEGNDVRSVLEGAEAVVRTGPTGTNVNDLRAIVVGSPADSGRGRKG
ncbi:hydroxypyruvate reductase [Halobiforma haloterrestris]|uniref:Hydroxypyruvate reductase n=1 Tax=Natronobacterium haloterrestre TaxID=148448 RepID=A0A1I1EF45_NATHA|nr:hydroxypyruvate reductase [Halobiforma haloterrestris]